MVFLRHCFSDITLSQSLMSEERISSPKEILQAKQAMSCPRETFLNGLLFELSPSADLLSGKASAASDSTSVHHISALSLLPCSVRCANSALQSRPCLSNLRCWGKKGPLRLSKLLSRLMSCTAHPTVCSDPGISTKKPGLQSKYVLESLDGQDKHNIILMQL